jgi:hypothetical protein
VTNAKFVSRVVNGLKALNVDAHVSKRHILGIGQNKSKFYISQKLLDKSLFKEDNLFRSLNCFRLYDEDRIQCGIYEFARCESLMKSAKKIPGLVYSRYGASIISVTSIDGLTRFVPTTLSNYGLFQDRQNASKFKDRTKFFYIKDGYLYLPNSEIEMVNIVYIPYEDSKIDECSECSQSNPCQSIWDREFIVPDKLGEQVISETVNEVFTGNRNSKDENPNGDNNIISSTTR